MADIEHSSAQRLNPEPFVEPSLRGALDAVRETVAARPQVLLVVVGGLAAVDVGLTLVRRIIDISGTISAGAIAMTAAFLIVYVLPRMWSSGLDYPVGRGELKAATTKLSEPATGAAISAGFFLSVGAAPLFVLLFFGENLSAAAFVGFFVVGAVVAIRVGMVVLLVVPLAVTTEDTDSWLITRGWRLSKAAFWPLAQIVLLVGAVFAGVLALSIWASGSRGSPLWVEDYIVFPLANGLHTGFAVLLSPAAYAVARHGAGGYGKAEALADLQEMLKIAPLRKTKSLGSLFRKAE